VEHGETNGGEAAELKDTSSQVSTERWESGSVFTESGSWYQCYPDPDSIRSVDPDPYLESGSKRAQLDPDWMRIWIGIQPKMLDPDPYQTKHCRLLCRIRIRIQSVAESGSSVLLNSDPIRIQTKIYYDSVNFFASGNLLVWSLLIQTRIRLSHFSDLYLL
jgi:hypothetical protein